MKRLAILLATILLFCAPSAFAQERAPSQATLSADRINALIDVLKDDGLRNQLILDLERARASPDAAEAAQAVTSTETMAGEEDALLGQGLMTGVSEWLTDLGERLPTAALGSTLDVKFAQAEAQVSRRLAVPGAAEDVRAFAWRSAVGWVLMTVLALFAAVYARRHIMVPVSRAIGTSALWRTVGLRAAMAFLPFLVCVLFSMIWTHLFSYSEEGAVTFLTMAVPIASALVVSGLMSALLVSLSRSKGPRLITYAQRRLSPLVGVLLGIATASSIVITPEMRRMIGPATSDLAALVLDIAVPAFAIVVIALHRRTLRSLIVRGHGAGEDPSLLDRAIYWTGTHWQNFGFLFAFLNIGARLFGAQSGDFLTQSSLSVVVIVIAFIAVASVERLEAAHEAAAMRRLRDGVRPRVVRRLASILYRALQTLAVVLAALLCLGFWGIDAAGWLGSGAGVAVVGPVLSIAMVMLTAWTLWVILDAWITAVLSAPATGPGYRDRSARVRTLLPLLRNVAFVVLSVLTAIGVLANLGINVAPLIAGAGVVGLAVGFGSQQLVQDVITGLFILLEDTLAIGDVVDTGDRAGTVEALTIRTVKIRDGDGALHTVPFSTVKALKNSSRGFGVYTVAITLEQGADVGNALEVLREVGDEVYRDPKYAGVILAPLDVLGVDHVGPDGIVIKGSIRTRPLQQHGVGREINRRLNIRLREKGVQLASRSSGSERRFDAAPA